jgi:hypothetical protein
MQPTAPTVLQTPQNLVKSVSKVDFKKNMPLILGTLAVVVLGVLTGWLLSGKGGATGGSAPNIKVSQNEAGILDESTFKGDTAEGELVEGGIGGEGTHHLEREGGPSKSVYLTSSVIDLESFVGKKVTVWGETLSAKKAGWLMDVLKVKVSE